MTLPEAGNKVIDALGGQPVLLAIIVLQVATLGMVYFISSANADRVQLRELALIAACGPKEH